MGWEPQHVSTAFQLDWSQFLLLVDIEVIPVLLHVGSKNLNNSHLPANDRHEHAHRD